MPFLLSLEHWSICSHEYAELCNRADNRIMLHTKSRTQHHAGFFSNLIRAVGRCCEVAANLGLKAEAWCFPKPWRFTQQHLWWQKSLLVFKRMTIIIFSPTCCFANKLLSCAKVRTCWRSIRACQLWYAYIEKFYNSIK